MDDFFKMSSLQVVETMYDIRFTPISYLQYMQLMDVIEKVELMRPKSKTEMVNLLKKYAPVYAGGMVMGKEDILNLYTKPYGFKCVEKSSLSDNCNSKITTLIGKNLFGDTTDIGNSAVKSSGVYMSAWVEGFDNRFTFYGYDAEVNHRNRYTRKDVE